MPTGGQKLFGRTGTNAERTYILLNLGETALHFCDDGFEENIEVGGLGKGFDFYYIEEIKQ